MIGKRKAKARAKKGHAAMVEKHKDKLQEWRRIGGLKSVAVRREKKRLAALFLSGK